MKKWWVIAGIFLVVLIRVVILFSHSSKPSENTILGSNGTRFVDGIKKIPTNSNRNNIQNALDKTGKSVIIIELKENADVAPVLSTLTPDEFQLIDTSIGSLAIITGNASKSAIEKLNKNQYVVSIYYAAAGGGST